MSWVNKFKKAYKRVEVLESKKLKANLNVKRQAELMTKQEEDQSTIYPLCEPPSMT